MPELNKKQKEFVDNYFICNFNATKAYRMTYPEGAAYAHANAGKLKAKPHVQAEIKRRMDEIVGNREELAEKMLFKLTDVAFDDKTSEEVPLTLQLKAVELLGKQLGVYSSTQRLQIEQVIFEGENTLED